MTEKEIAVLLGRIRESDELAFEALYRAFAPRVKAFVLLRLFSRDPDTVEEIVSDTFVAVWRSAGTFKGNSRFSTWLLGIAWKTLLIKVRGNPPVDTADIEELTDLVDESAGVFEWLARKERAQALSICLEKLSLEQRTTLFLTHVEGLSRADVSRVMAVPENTVKSRLRNAIHNILPCVMSILRAEGDVPLDLEKAR